MTAILKRKKGRRAENLNGGGVWGEMITFALMHMKREGMRGLYDYIRTYRGFHEKGTHSYLSHQG